MVWGLGLMEGTDILGRYPFGLHVRTSGLAVDGCRMTGYLQFRV